MSTPAGWYPDPERAGQQRYWDGQQWTDNRAVYAQPEATGSPVGWWRSNRAGLIVAGAVLAAIVILPAALSRGGDSSNSTGGTTSNGSTGSQQQDQADDDSRCEKVPKSVLKEIGSPGQTLTDGWSVRSDDYKKVWFVAARYMNTWPVFSVNGDPSSPDTAFSGLTLSVNDDANDFFPYPYGPDTPAQVSMSDDGAREAEQCSLESGG